jgi:uncharacterized protein
MSYNFNFDLSKLSHAFFKEIAEFSEHDKLNEKIANMARNLVQRFNVDRNTGLPITDSITVIEDLIHVNMRNTLSRDSFLQTNKRALFLPHCCRKYMDSRCKAAFNTKTSSYECNHCSQDCLVHQATLLAQERQYDVYVLPGASGVRKIFQHTAYDGVVGVACTEEIKLAMDILEKNNIPTQGIPLIKNGCSETQFNYETLSKVLVQNGKKQDMKQ